ncbi:hypothetical protein B6D60_04395 [candidate division KSB1 bacterium 4484_87]|nr:MAG: hypothetical protein B6D60_04395 [candidate division KSB1 bacterium 4484_87]
MVRKGILWLIVSFFALASLGNAFTPFSNGSMPSGKSSGKLSERFEIFAGAGYFQPSLKNWNNAFRNFNAAIRETGAADLHNFQIVKNGELTALESGYSDLGGYDLASGENYLASDMMYHVGMRYFFNKNLNLSFTVSSFHSEASSSFSAENQGKEDFWPNYGYQVQDQVSVTQKIAIFPTILSLNFNLPISPWRENFEVYGGAGVGFNFSKIKSEIADKYGLTQLRGDAVWDSLSIEPNPLSLNIISNIQANANPFSFQVSAGTNVKFGIVTINFEIGYNFAKAKINDEDWRFYTRKFTPIVKVEGKQAPEYDVKYTEDRKYYFEIPESAFDDLKVKEIDYSGVMIKGGIGLSF